MTVATGMRSSRATARIMSREIGLTLILVVHATRWRSFCS
jgi:hypothetical protein